MNALRHFLQSDFGAGFCFGVVIGGGIINTLFAFKSDRDAIARAEGR